MEALSQPPTSPCTHPILKSMQIHNKSQKAPSVPLTLSMPVSPRGIPRSVTVKQFRKSHRATGELCSHVITTVTRAGEGGCPDQKAQRVWSLSAPVRTRLYSFLPLYSNNVWMNEQRVSRIHKAAHVFLNKTIFNSVHRLQQNPVTNNRLDITGEIRPNTYWTAHLVLFWLNPFG